MPNIVSPHATWAYSWMRPPSRSCRRTRILAPAADGPWRPAGGFWCSVLCGRWGVVMVGVLAEDQLQVPFAGDQHPVQALAAGTGDPAFGYSVAQHRQLHPIRMIGTDAPV